MTGVSRIAGGPGTKKVRTLSGALRPPQPPHSPRAPSAPPPPRTSRLPRGLTLEARGPQASSGTFPPSPPLRRRGPPSHPETPGFRVQSCKRSRSGPHRLPLPVFIRRGTGGRAPPSVGARGRTLGPRLSPAPPPPRARPLGPPRGPPGAHRLRTGSPPSRQGPWRRPGPAPGAEEGRRAGCGARLRTWTLRRGRSAVFFLVGWGGGGSCADWALPPRLPGLGGGGQPRRCARDAHGPSRRGTEVWWSWNRAGRGRGLRWRVAGAGHRSLRPAGSPGPPRPRRGRRGARAWGMGRRA